MSTPNRKFNIEQAKPADAEGLKKVFNDGSFPGNIAVHFAREPDILSSFKKDGNNIILPVIKDKDGEILGMGGCVVRSAYVNGTPQNTAYLTGLKLLQSHQRKVRCIPQAYDFIAQQASQYKPYYYTTILKDNKAAIRLLERPHKGIPPYQFIGEYTVFCLGTKQRIKAGNLIFKQGHTKELAEFYNKNLKNYNLAPTNEFLYGLTKDDFYYLSTQNGEILAAAAIWNQQEYKQYNIVKYGGIYKFLSHMPTKLLGYPAFPKVGGSANYASVSMLIATPDIAQLFVKLLFKAAHNYDFLMLGLFENHPLLPVIADLKHVKYQSRLYSVNYPDNFVLDSRPVMLEVGLL